MREHAGEQDLEGYRKIGSISGIEIMECVDVYILERDKELFGVCGYCGVRSAAAEILTIQRVERMASSIASGRRKQGPRLHQ